MSSFFEKPMLIAAFLTIFAGTNATQRLAQSSPNQARQWDVKYRGGLLSSDCGGRKTALVITSNLAIHCGSQVFRIRPEHIVEIGADFAEFGYGTFTSEFFWKQSVQPAIVLEKRVVRVTWSSKGISTETFQIQERDYKAFLDELQNLTGKAWLDLPKLRERIRQEIQKDDASPELTLDQQVLVGPLQFGPGTYRLVLIDDIARDPILCFCQKKGDMVRTVARVAVKITRESESIAKPRAVYDTRETRAKLASIRISDKSLIPY